MKDARLVAVIGADGIAMRPEVCWSPMLVDSPFAKPPRTALEYGEYRWVVKRAAPAQPPVWQGQWVGCGEVRCPRVRREAGSIDKKQVISAFRALQTLAETWELRVDTEPDVRWDEVILVVDAWERHGIGLGTTFVRPESEPTDDTVYLQ